MKRHWRIGLVLLLVFGGLVAYVTKRERLEIAGNWARLKVGHRYTVADRLTQFGAAAEARMRLRFAAAGVAYPPKAVALLALKSERMLELHAQGATSDEWRLVHRYPVLGASGTLGPKLREGDLQVPEGVYRVTFLNPNSLFHVSLRLDYPNTFDKAMGVRDGRGDLGGDIMIHGKSSSIGCLAMGDEVAEELFTLAARIGMANVEVVIAPTDFRVRKADGPATPTWLPELYGKLATRMKHLSAR